MPSSFLRTLAVGAAAASALAGSGALHSVRAWGPLAHSQFVCTLLTGMQEATPPVALIGSDLPDGMWNGWFLSGTQCPPKANAMHSPVYAGYLLQEAQQNPKYNTDPYFYALAAGYMSHVVSDEVGFAPQGGYLGNVSSIINWSLEWPFMLAVDANLRQGGFWPSNCTMPRSALEPKGVAFLADVNAKYAASNPNFPLLTADEIAACTDPWAAQVNEMIEYAIDLPYETMMAQLVFFDRFGARTYNEALNNLVKSTTCVQQSLNFFLGNIATNTPEQTWSLTQQYIASSFAVGQCTVQPPPPLSDDSDAQRPHALVQATVEDEAAASSPYWFDFFAWNDGECSKTVLGSAAVTPGVCAPTPALFNNSFGVWYRVTVTEPMTNGYEIDAWYDAECTGFPDVYLANAFGTDCQSFDSLGQPSFRFHSPIIAPLTIAWYAAYDPHCHCSQIEPGVPPDFSGIVPNSCQDLTYLTLFENGTFSLNIYNDEQCQSAKWALNLTGRLDECVDSPICGGHYGTPVMVTKTPPAAAPSRSHRSRRTPHRILDEEALF